MIYDHKLLGNCVDGSQAWFNNAGSFAEVGNGSWRVSFTPTVAGKYMVMTSLKHRMGSGSAEDRLYCKARIVQVSPIYKNDFALFSEAMWEGAFGYGDQVRFFDAPITPFIVVEISSENLNTEHVFAVEYMAGDGVLGQVGYGSPLVIFG